MSDYTPTTEEVRKILATCNPDVVYNHDLVSEFDRWLDEVKAQVWEEGYTQGNNDMYNGDLPTPNPYRQGEAQ